MDRSIAFIMEKVLYQNSPDALAPGLLLETR